MTTITIFDPRAFRLPGHPLLRCAVAVDETRDVAITVWEADPQADTANVGPVKRPLHPQPLVCRPFGTPPPVVPDPYTFPNRPCMPRTPFRARCRVPCSPDCAECDTAHASSLARVLNPKGALYADIVETARRFLASLARNKD